MRSYYVGSVGKVMKLEGCLKLVGKGGDDFDRVKSYIGYTSAEFDSFLVKISGDKLVSVYGCYQEIPMDGSCLFKIEEEV